MDTYMSVYSQTIAIKQHSTQCLNILIACSWHFLFVPYIATSETPCMQQQN